MTGIDTNILVDLLVSSTPHHAQAVEGIANIEDEPCTTPTNIGEVLRLITHPKVFPKALTLTRAVEVLTQMLDYYRIRILTEDADWWKSLPEIEKEIPGIRGNEIFDARIALCLKSNGTKRIYTRDADFKKYSFLKVVHGQKL
jgi:predicted nucleic acid-binding protein